MKPILFSASVAALLAAASFTAQARTLAPAPVDTIVVRLPNKAVMTLVVRDAQQLRQLPQYHLDSLVARLGGYIRQADVAAAKSGNDRVTVAYFPNQDQPGQNLPEEIRITTRKPTAGAYGPSNRIEVLLEKKFGVVINTDSKNNDHPRAAADRADRQAHRDSLNEARLARHRSNVNLVFDLGLNALTNRGSGAPELRTLGSRYVNLGFDAFVRLGGPHSPAHLVFGPEFAFNNYMLEGNTKWVSVPGAGGTSITAVVPETNGRQYQKTKLATTTFTVPLMFQLNLTEKNAAGRSKAGFTIGAGGFVGYRLASWTKLKYFEEGSTYKDKNSGSYNLNDWQYGLQGVVGYHSLTFFAKYNLNELFREGQGPQAQTLSFGLRFGG
jgi:hypothetical protein